MFAKTHLELGRIGTQDMRIGEFPYVIGINPYVTGMGSLVNLSKFAEVKK